MGVNKINEGKAYGSMAFEFEFTDRALQLSNVLLDKIQFVAGLILAYHISAGDGDPDLHLNPLLAAFTHIQSLTSDVYPELLISFALTLTVGHFSGTDQPSPLAHDRSEADAIYMARWYRQLIGVKDSMALNRLFFITGKGRMGIGPPCLRAGDFCAVSFGAKVPFVFRGNGDERV